MLIFIHNVLVHISAMKPKLQEIYILCLYLVSCFLLSCMRLTICFIVSILYSDMCLYIKSMFKENKVKTNLSKCGSAYKKFFGFDRSFLINYVRHLTEIKLIKNNFCLQKTTNTS